MTTKDRPAGFPPFDKSKMSTFETHSTAIKRMPEPVLPNASKKNTLATDVCNVEAGYVSLQKQQEDTAE